MILWGNRVSATAALTDKSIQDNAKNYYNKGGISGDTAANKGLLLLLDAMHETLWQDMMHQNCYHLR